MRHTPEIPAWPQLPRLGFKHNMIAQFAHDLPGAAIDEKTKNVYLDLSTTTAKELEAYYEKLLSDDMTRFALDREHFPGLYAFASRSSRLRSSIAVKGHMSGPVTMGMQVLSQSGTPVLFERAEMELLLKTLKLKARWQENFLRRLNQNTIVLVDEPSMTLLGSPCVPIQKEMAISLIDEVLSQIGGLKGVHCCGNTDWAVLMDTDINILSFDAYNLAGTLALYASNVESFLSRNGMLAWGITPTIDGVIEKETVDSLMTRFHEAVRQLVDKGMSLDTILGASLITPACGLGMVTPVNAVKALNMTSELSARLRKEHGMEI